MIVVIVCLGKVSFGLNEISKRKDELNLFVNHETVLLVKGAGPINQKNC